MYNYIFGVYPHIHAGTYSTYPTECSKHAWHAYIRTSKHMYIHATSIHTYKHAHAYIHTHIHTYTHTCVCVYVRLRVCACARIIGIAFAPFAASCTISCMQWRAVPRTTIRSADSNYNYRRMHMHTYKPSHESRYILLPCGYPITKGSDTRSVQLCEPAG